MRKAFYKILLLTVFFLSIGLSGASAQIYKLELSTPQTPITVGSSFDVKIYINTESQAVNSGDTLFLFDPVKITFNSATDGRFFEYFNEGLLGGYPNKYLISAWENPGHEKTAATNTLFGTLNLKANATGSATLSFECTSGTDADTNINRSSDSKDIVNCSGLTPLVLNIGGGSSAPTSTPLPQATATPNPTSVPTSTPVPAATATPIPPTATKVPTPTLLRAGASGVTIIALGVGTLLTVIGILAIL